MGFVTEPIGVVRLYTYALKYDACTARTTCNPLRHGDGWLAYFIVPNEQKHQHYFLFLLFTFAYSLFSIIKS